MLFCQVHLVHQVYVLIDGFQILKLATMVINVSRMTFLDNRCPLAWIRNPLF